MFIVDEKLIFRADIKVHAQLATLGAARNNYSWIAPEQMRLYYFLPPITLIKRCQGRVGGGDYRELFTCHKAQITSTTRVGTYAI